MSSPGEHKRHLPRIQIGRFSIENVATLRKGKWQKIRQDERSGSELPSR